MFWPLFKMYSLLDSIIENWTEVQITRWLKLSLFFFCQWPTLIWTTDNGRPKTKAVQHRVEVLYTHSFKVQFSAHSAASKFFCLRK